eukprot:scaffold81242_cov60-Phaeocystis_antarctica.AAC.2
MEYFPHVAPRYHARSRRRPPPLRPCAPNRPRRRASPRRAWLRPTAAGGARAWPQPAAAAVQPPPPPRAPAARA